MPFVQQHLERYQREEHTRLMACSSRGRPTTGSRRQSPDQLVALMAASSAAPPAAGRASRAAGNADAGDTSLTPKQRLVKRKEDERRKREMELRLASMSMASERPDLADRKHRMVRAAE